MRNALWFLSALIFLSGTRTGAKDAYSGASFGAPTNRVQYAPIPSDVSKDLQAIKVSTDVAGPDVTTGPTYIHYSDGKGFRIYSNPRRKTFIKVVAKGNSVRISAPYPTEDEAAAATVGKPMKKGKNLGARPMRAAPKPAAQPTPAAESNRQPPVKAM